MSDPVGNSPRDISVPNKSHRARTEEPAPVAPKVEEREELKQIIEGKVVIRKTPRWKRMLTSVVAEDASSVSEYLFTDVIGPAVRNLIRDIIVGGTDRTLYGSTRSRRAEDPVRGGGIRRRYDRMAEEPLRPAGRSISREARARHDFREVTLESREEALDIVEALDQQVVRYGSASVAELYRLLGTTGSYTDRGWGWTDLSQADVVQQRGGWLIDLPAPEPLPT